MSILVVGDLVFPVRYQYRYVGREETTHPSYSPTASCTKSRVSSGNSKGLSADVRSRALKNI